jgi:uncharacterized membrane protein YsdA (DUF1294 family)/cold shock CspA family protein
MRYKGVITNWKDDKGFGFITPNGGGKQIFVHIKSFPNRRRRPVDNEIVTYELETDSQGRAQAVNIAFDDEKLAWASPSWRLLLASLFLAFLAGATFAGELSFAVFGLYVIASTVAFFVYAHDKAAASNDCWRTQESTLHFVGLIGGWPGALAAQEITRHKSKKRSFQVVFWGTVMLNCAALGWLFLDAGAKNALGWLFSDAGSRTLRLILGAP